MTPEKPSSPGRRAEIEVSALPQVAALSSALTTLFNSLDVTQNQYAVRVNLDKSLVSRFLNGRRVASVEFIDRLVSEVEHHRRPVTEEVRNRVKQYRLEALRVLDPRQYELEILQARAIRTERDIHRLSQQCEALSLLLDQKEAEARSARSELLQLQGDWIAERVESEARSLVNRRNQETLEDAILDLRRQLTAALSQRDLAEQRCADLGQQLSELEEQIAIEREVGGSAGDQQSLGALQLVLENSWAKGEVHAAARELTEAAWTLPLNSLLELSRWLTACQRIHEVKRLLVDATRVRPIGQVAELFEKLPDSRLTAAPKNPRLRSAMLAEIAVSRTFEEVLELLTSSEFTADKAYRWRLADLWSRAPRPAGDVARMLGACTDLEISQAGFRIAGPQARRPLEHVIELLGLLTAAGQLNHAKMIAREFGGNGYDPRYRDGNRSQLFALSEACLDMADSTVLLRELYSGFDTDDVITLAFDLARVQISDLANPKLRIFRFLASERGDEIAAHFSDIRQSSRQTDQESSWHRLVALIGPEPGPHLPEPSDVPEATPDAPE